MKIALTQLLEDLLSALVFIALFKLTGSLVLATVFAVIIAVAQLVAARMRGKPISAMQWLLLALMLVLSSLTLLTEDSRFVQLKPTIVHFAVGMVMLKPGWQLPYLLSLASSHIRSHELLCNSRSTIRNRATEPFSAESGICADAANHA